MTSVPACSQVAKLCGELLVAVQNEESRAAQKAVDRVGEIPTDLHHERAVRPGSDSGNVHFSRRELDVLFTPYGLEERAFIVRSNVPGVATGL